MSRDWNHRDRQEPPDVPALLYTFRRPLAVAFVVYNALVGYWTWGAWGRSRITGWLGLASLIMFNLVAGLVALYVWWSIRR